MKLAVGIIICFLSLNVYSGGMDDFPEKISKKFGLDKLNSRHLNDVEMKSQAATIFTILAYTRELKIHQMNGAEGNQVYLHKDGHKEAVYDSAGKIVKDCLNQGSYNYYHPQQLPLAHFTGDILPWLIFGNCPEDPSSKEQRIKAYVSDIRIGFEQVLKSKQAFYLPKGFDFQEYGQSVAVSFYLEALLKAGFDFSHFVSENINNKEQQEKFFMALEKGFSLLLKGQ